MESKREMSAVATDAPALGPGLLAEVKRLRKIEQLMLEYHKGLIDRVSVLQLKTLLERGLEKDE